MPLKCAVFLFGFYGIDDFTNATENESVVSTTRLEPNTREKILEKVFKMVENLGFSKNHVDYLLIDLGFKKQMEGVTQTCTSKSIHKFTFMNSSGEVISESQISLPQLLIILHYTSSGLSNTCSRDLAQMLKEALRERNREDVIKLRHVIKTLDGALECLPRYKSEEALFRGEQVKIECLQPGVLFYMVHFTSFSQNVSKALDFTTKQTHTLFLLRNPKSGADIAFASEHEDEMEVLYPRNTRFEVLHVFSGAQARDHVPELQNTIILDELTVIVIAEV